MKVMIKSGRAGVNLDLAYRAFGETPSAHNFSVLHAAMFAYQAAALDNGVEPLDVYQLSDIELHAYLNYNS